jgi:hypothetical protein
MKLQLSLPFFEIAEVAFVLRTNFFVGRPA